MYYPAADAARKPGGDLGIPAAEIWRFFIDAMYIVERQRVGVGIIDPRMKRRQGSKSVKDCCLLPPSRLAP